MSATQFNRMVRGLAGRSLTACLVGTLVLGAIPSDASANLVVNGSFETNTAPSTVFNPFNAVFNSYMSSVNAYGIREGIDIQTIGSGYGLAPVDGIWKVSPASDANGTNEELAMALSSPLMTGSGYDLSFYMEALHSGGFNGGHVEIGASTSDSSFGTLVYTSADTVDAWTPVSTSFMAPNAATHLTVRVDTDVSGWVGLDNFVLTASTIPEPTVFGVVVGGMMLMARRRVPPGAMDQN